MKPSNKPNESRGREQLKGSYFNNYAPLYGPSQETDSPNTDDERHYLYHCNLHYTTEECSPWKTTLMNS